MSKDSQPAERKRPRPATQPLGMDVKSLRGDLERHLHLTLGEDVSRNRLYLFNATALTVRDRLVEQWRATRQRYQETHPRQVAYLSLEFLMGRALTNAAFNLDMEESLRTVLHKYGVSLEELAEQERDAGLGNGGLGRLAACFLDSCATLGLPVTGYGIRYDYGMFHQRIEDGYQVEQPDHWLERGNPWEFEAPQEKRRIRFRGRTEQQVQADGSVRTAWVDTEDVLALPYDM